MKLALLTTRGNFLFTILYTAFLESNGPMFSAIIFLPERKDLSYPWWGKGYVGLKLLGLPGIFKLTRIQQCSWLLSKSERRLGLGLSWTTLLPKLCTEHYDISVSEKDKFSEMLRQISPDIIVSVGSPIIFTNDILQLANVGCLNLHNGRVPMYRGHFATFWEILAQEEWSYVSIHEMKEKVDTGRVLAVDSIEVKKTASFLDLVIAKKAMGGRLLANLLLEVADLEALPKRDFTRPEDLEAGRYFRWPTPADVRLFRWKKPRSTN